MYLDVRVLSKAFEIRIRHFNAGVGKEYLRKRHHRDFPHLLLQNVRDLLFFRSCSHLSVEGVLQNLSTGSESSLIAKEISLQEAVPPAVSMGIP